MSTKRRPRTHPVASGGGPQPKHNRNRRRCLLPFAGADCDDEGGGCNDRDGGTGTVPISPERHNVRAVSIENRTPTITSTTDDTRTRAEDALYVTLEGLSSKSDPTENQKSIHCYIATKSNRSGPTGYHKATEGAQRVFNPKPTLLSRRSKGLGRMPTCVCLLVQRPPPKNQQRANRLLWGGERKRGVAGAKRGSVGRSFGAVCAATTNV
jgi:hypothetical protein